MRSLSPLLVHLIAAAASAETLVYFGTYTKNSTSEGVYVSTLDEETGELSEPKLAAKAVNPSFVALAPNGKTLYSVSEWGGPYEKGGAVIAFRIEDDGTLTELNAQPTGGGGACHVSVSPDGSVVAAANYSGGSVASFPVNQEGGNDDGSLGDRASFIQHVGGSGVDPKRQNKPHAHSINFTGNRGAIVADLGLDQVVRYRLDGAKLMPHKQLSTQPGGGPRHVAMSHSEAAPFAFVNLEIASAVQRIDNDGQLSAPVSTLPDGAAASSPNWRAGGNNTAECLLAPNDKTLYVSNRGHNSIAVFSVSADGDLKLIQNQSTFGEIPRGFGLSPDGRFLIVGNQNTDNVAVLAIDPADGTLSDTGHRATLGKPVNVRFLKR